MTLLSTESGKYYEVQKVHVDHEPSVSGRRRVDQRWRYGSVFRSRCATRSKAISTLPRSRSDRHRPAGSEHPVRRSKAKVSPSIPPISRRFAPVCAPPVFYHEMAGPDRPGRAGPPRTGGRPLGLTGLHRADRRTSGWPNCRVRHAKVGTCVAPHGFLVFAPAGGALGRRVVQRDDRPTRSKIRFSVLPHAPLSSGSPAWSRSSAGRYPAPGSAIPLSATAGASDATKIQHRR